MTRRRILVVQFVVLTGFWFALSGRTDPLFVVSGLATAAAVTALTHRITRSYLPAEYRPRRLRQLPSAAIRAIGFGVWMAGRILVASVQLASIALSPRMPLAPCTVRFRTELRRPLARTTLANAISLVPGTLTVDIDGDEILVHALSPRQVDDLVSGRLQNKVAALFLEAPQPAVDRAAITPGELS